MKTELTSETLIKLGFYCELSFNTKWCFKHQFPGQDVIIVSDIDKEKAASLFFIELLKSLHYSLKWLYENNRIDELRNTIEKYQNMKDENINKTISIATRNMKFITPKQ